MDLYDVYIKTKESKFVKIRGKHCTLSLMIMHAYTHAKCNLLHSPIKGKVVIVNLRWNGTGWPEEYSQICAVNFGFTGQDQWRQKKQKWMDMHLCWKI